MSDHDAIREHLKYYRDLGVMGITTDPKWRERMSEAVVAQPPAESAEALAKADAVAPAPSDSAASLAAVRDFIGVCTRCKLSGLGRKTVVFGTGNPNADLMFVGEAPGADEDEQGVPFVGRAGQLLTKIFEAIGLRRDDVYIANVIKCRPPGNRNPEPDEVATCEPFLAQQIDIVRPRVIVALGTFAAHLLLRTDAPISRIRGVVHEYRGASLIPTFHPAYLLRSPDRKREVWDDMKKVRALLAEAP
jgi:DNA polymerase